MYKASVDLVEGVLQYASMRTVGSAIINFVLHVVRQRWHACWHACCYVASSVLLSGLSQAHRAILYVVQSHPAAFHVVQFWLNCMWYSWILQWYRFVDPSDPSRLYLAQPSEPAASDRPSAPKYAPNYGVDEAYEAM